MTMKSSEKRIRSLRQTFDTKSISEGDALRAKDYFTKESFSVLVKSICESSITLILADSSTITLDVDEYRHEKYHIVENYTKSSNIYNGGLVCDLRPIFDFFIRGEAYTFVDKEGREISFIMKEVYGEYDPELIINTAEGRNRIKLENLLDTISSAFHNVYKANKPKETFLKFLDSYKYEDREDENKEKE